jgi:hypothetical protein
MITKEIEQAAVEMAVDARKQLNKICEEAGLTPEQIQEAVDRGLASLTINGALVFPELYEKYKKA